jgi:phosphate acyltransferase
LLTAVLDFPRASPRGRAGGLLLRPALRDLRDRISAERAGGAHLLGLRRLGVVPHGRFARDGIAQAILLAARGHEGDLAGRTHAALEAAGALRSAPSPSV